MFQHIKSIKYTKIRCYEYASRFCSCITTYAVTANSEVSTRPCYRSSLLECVRREKWCEGKVRIRRFRILIRTQSNFIHATKHVAEHKFRNEGRNSITITGGFDDIMGIFCKVISYFKRVLIKIVCFESHETFST